MSMTINTNIDALNALRNLTTTGTAFSSSVEKLSSGLRINTAADDAAGLSIATKLQSQVTGLNQAQRNAQDGVSMVQTAEGALNQVQTMLQRIRELAVEAGNSTLSSSDAASVNSEITALQAEITRTANSTTFNGQHLLTGNMAPTVGAGGIQVGTALATATHTSVIGVDVSGANAGDTYTIVAGTDAGTIKVTSANLAAQEAAESAALVAAGGNALTGNAIDGTVDDNVSVTDMTGKAGVQQVKFANAGITLTLATTAAGDTGAHIVTGLTTAATVKTGAGSAAATFQIGANEGDTLAVSFDSAGLLTSATSTPPSPPSPPRLRAAPASPQPPGRSSPRPTAQSATSAK